MSEVAIAMIECDGRWLLQLRDDIEGILYPGQWALFGGHLDPGETPEVALRRELEEEINWAGSDLGAPLQVARGIMPVMQPQGSLDALGAAAATHDDWELGMLYRATTLGGSLVLGLAMLRGRMDAAGLFEAAFLDELWQAQKWGSDWEAEDRRAMIRGEIEQAHHFLSLLRNVG